MSTPEKLRPGNLPATESFTRYKRARFSTQLPNHYLYTPAHYWLQDLGEKRWRVGLTKFAVRMLGELVEHDFELPAGQAMAVGNIIGWIEGFKATSDIYASCSGTFSGANPGLVDDPEMLQRSPYRDGYLYEAEGEPDPAAFGVNDYIAYLDATIEKLEHR